MCSFGTCGAHKREVATGTHGGLFSFSGRLQQNEVMLLNV